MSNPQLDGTVATHLDRWIVIRELLMTISLRLGVDAPYRMGGEVTRSDTVMHSVLDVRGKHVIDLPTEEMAQELVTASRRLKEDERHGDVSIDLILNIILRLHTSYEGSWEWSSNRGDNIIRCNNAGRTTIIAKLPTEAMTQTLLELSLKVHRERHNVT